MRVSTVKSVSVALCSFLFCIRSVSAQTADDKRLFQEYLRLKAAAGTSVTECGPKADGTATIVGRVPASGSDLSLPVILRIFPAGPGADAYLGTLSGRFASSSSDAQTPEAAIAALQAQERRMSTISTLYSSMRNARAESDGRFACKGLAPGRYVLMYQVVTTSGTSIAGTKIPLNEFFTSEVSIPKEKPGYRYIVTAPTFQILRP